MDRARIVARPRRRTVGDSPRTIPVWRAMCPTSLHVRDPRDQAGLVRIKSLAGLSPRLVARQISPLARPTRAPVHDSPRTVAPDRRAVTFVNLAIRLSLRPRGGELTKSSQAECPLGTVREVTVVSTRFGRNSPHAPGDSLGSGHPKSRKSRFERRDDPASAPRALLLALRPGWPPTARSWSPTSSSDVSVLRTSPDPFSG